MQASGEAEELGRRHPLVEGRDIGQEPHLGTDGIARRGDIVSEYMDRPFRRPGEPCGESKGRGLPRPVRSEESEDGPLLDIEIEGVEDELGAVRLGQSGGLDR